LKPNSKAVINRVEVMSNDFFSSLTEFPGYIIKVLPNLVAYRYLMPTRSGRLAFER